MKQCLLCFLLLLSSLTYAAGEENVRNTFEFLDALSTQFNLGYTHFDLSDKTNNILITNSQRTFNDSGKGLHGSLLLLDEMELHDSFYIGARVGFDFWSDLSADYASPSFYTGYTSRYNLQKMYGFFGDVTFDLELVTDKFDIYGFVGAGYNRYQLKGVNTMPLGAGIIFTETKRWLTSPRAGVGLSYTFKRFYLIGVEYTHMFRNSLNIRSTGGGLARDNLNHQFKGSDDSIDLTISVYMNT